MVESLNEHKRANQPETASLTAKIFAILFPSSPAVNALLATLYISGPPSKLFQNPHLNTVCHAYLFRLPLGTMPAQH